MWELLNSPGRKLEQYGQEGLYWATPALCDKVVESFKVFKISGEGHSC